MRYCDTNNQDVAITQIHLLAVSADVIFPISHDALHLCANSRTVVENELFGPSPRTSSNFSFIQFDTSSKPVSIHAKSTLFVNLWVERECLTGKLSSERWRPELEVPAEK